jgi:hypothetical protein
VYAGKRGRVPRPVVKSLLAKFAQSADDHSAVNAILAALPAAADNLVGFRELTAAVRKVAVRSHRSGACLLVWRGVSLMWMCNHA